MPKDSSEAIFDRLESLSDDQINADFKESSFNTNIPENFFCYSFIIDNKKGSISFYYNDKNDLFYNVSLRYPTEVLTIDKCLNGELERISRKIYNVFYFKKTPGL